MTSLVDLHCHLDLYPDFEKLVEECESEKIYTLAVTTTPRAWPRNFELTKDKKYVRAALGLHPQLVAQHANELELWDKFFSQAKYIGEIGLDAGPAFYKSLPSQEIIFEHIIKRCASEGKRILTIHSVRTAQKIIDVLEKYGVCKNNGVVLHWFGGTNAQVRKAAQLGCYFSVNSQMFTKGDKLITSIPRNRILTETDGPFTKLGENPQKPANVVHCVDLIANVLKISSIEARNLVGQNFRELLIN
jgi:TatD DNase family protein